MEHLAGRFIVIDGSDGCGKSTQVRLLAEQLGRDGLTAITCRDPGGTEIGDRIRAVLLNHDLSTMDHVCETFLFMASRAQLLAEVIRPALARGESVVCDRFVSSTYAYQGAAGMNPQTVIDVARFVVGDQWPDLTIVLDVDVDEAFARIGDRKRDAMESRPRQFHERVRELFRQCPHDYPSPVIVVDGRGDAQQVHARVMEALARVTV